MLDPAARAARLPRVSGPDRHCDPFEVRRGERGEALRRAFSEFPGFSLSVVCVLVAGWALARSVDSARPEWLSGARRFLQRGGFTSADAPRT